MTGVSERHVALDGAVNFRDIGGYRAHDGRRVRWRRVFRADGLSGLTAHDREVVGRLGIVTVIDLRTTVELESGKFPDGEIPVRFHHLPLLDAVPDAERFEMAPGMLAAQYQEIAHDAGPRIADALAILADPRNLPAVVHCTAGKDRTGVLVAVVLGLLGVPDATIVDDYALSGEAMDRLRRKLVDRYPEGRTFIEEANELFSAAPATMADLLSSLRRRHGSFEGYGRHIGVPAETIAMLRAALLTDDSTPLGLEVPTGDRSPRRGPRPAR
ncbi:MAG: tyrosine-protein phosphatase [Actinomycetota bacterium]|nr:tyrosine-protein phosphatase [Actinomycetota bacterium]